MQTASRIRDKEDRAREEGVVVGHMAGERAKAIEIAKNLLTSGVSIEVISKASGLTINEIEKLN